MTNDHILDHRWPGSPGVRPVRLVPSLEASIVTWMGWLAVGLAPSALVGVWALWANLKRKERCYDRQAPDPA